MARALSAQLRSAHLRDPATAGLASLLAISAIVGTPIGEFANYYVSPAAFGALLGTCIIVVAALVIARWRRIQSYRATPRSRTFMIGVLAAAPVSCSLGDQLLTVPLLIVTGTPTLSALASAQVQSIVITGVGTVGYASLGDVSWPLADLISVPVLLGTSAGWLLARTLRQDRLGIALGSALMLVGTYLLARSS